MSNGASSNGINVIEEAFGDPRRATVHPLIQRNQIQALTAMEHVSHVTPEQRREMREKQQRLIEGGYVELGPLPDHSMPTADIRDMRDPEDLGLHIQRMVAKRGDCTTASAAADMIPGLFDIRRYTDGGLNHAELRRQELQHRADSGDRFAAALLRGETLAEEPVD